MLKQKPLAAAVALAWLGMAGAPALAQNDAGSSQMQTVEVTGISSLGRVPSRTRFAALQNCWYPPGYPSSRSVPQMTRQVNPLSFATCNSERTALRSLALS